MPRRLRRCERKGRTVRDPTRIPPHPSERALYDFRVGCNRLRCARCRSIAEVRDGRYACGCAEAPLEDECLGHPNFINDIFAPTPPDWSCAGHPWPEAEDLRAMGYTDDLLRDLDEALRQREVPPHHPSGHQGYVADVRLDLEPEFRKAPVLSRVVGALDGDDDFATLRALHLLSHRGWVPMEGAVFRWHRLAVRTNPVYPTLHLGRSWEWAVTRQAADEGDDAVREARRVLEAAGSPVPKALSGED